MGCDIHAYIDRTVFVTQEGQPWRSCVAELNLNRSYDLFHVLAGVRTNLERHTVEPVSDPKGLPENISSEVRMANRRWSADGHSHSYLTLEECREAQRRYVQTVQNIGYGPSLDLNVVLTIMETLEEAKTDPLFIFWFDN